MLVQSKCLFIFMLYFTWMLGSLECQRYEKLQGYVLSSWTKLWSDDVALSVIQCIAVCKLTANCYAISVAYPAGLCAYYNWFVDGPAALEISFGTENDYVILVKPIPVLYVAEGYSFSFAAAGNFCTSVGGRIVTYSELEAEWNKGYDICGCGWVFNGHAYLASSVPREGCSDTVSLSHCDWSTEWDVYCKIE